MEHMWDKYQFFVAGIWKFPLVFRSIKKLMGKMFRSPVRSYGGLVPNESATDLNLLWILLRREPCIKRV